MLDRRLFLKISALAAAGLAANQSRVYLTESPAMPPRAPALRTDHLPMVPCRRAAVSYLALRFPWLRHGEGSGKGGLRIAATCSLPPETAGARYSGPVGERVYQAGSGGQFLPWAPMFERPTPVIEADPALRELAQLRRLYLKDEGSLTAALFGNKVRKYEFLLPNLALSGVRRVCSHGAFGSNHCAYLALAARHGAYFPGGQSGPMEVELSLYPQEITENVIAKLRLLVASGARLRFLPDDLSVGISILKAQYRAGQGADPTVAYLPPGGSTPLTVLGHVEAVMELAAQIESGASPLAAPPDFIFVPLGSGATAMGLLLGCHLLGWPTKVVGTCSQDKNSFARMAANGDPGTPFLVANAGRLLEKALVWLRRMGLPAGGVPAVPAAEILRRGFLYDNVTWHPGYGKASPEVRREADLAARAGLVLDHTFTAKSFHTLKKYAAHGVLDNKHVLFWNTYQRFPLERLLPDDPNWSEALPGPIRDRVLAYRGHSA